VTRERFGVAHVDHSLEQLQRIEAFDSGIKSAFDGKREK